MKGYSPDILNVIRRELEDEKQKVVARINDLTAQDPYADPGRLDDNAASDREANEEASHDRFSALVSELEAQLISIDEALMRVSSGNYGFCTNCQTMINNDRLMILPTATLCLECEQKRKKIGT